MFCVPRFTAGVSVYCVSARVELSSVPIRHDALGI